VHLITNFSINASVEYKYIDLSHSLWMHRGPKLIRSSLSKSILEVFLLQSSLVPFPSEPHVRMSTQLVHVACGC